MKIGILGLGYVGLPLAVEFGKKYHTIGFDVNGTRVAELVNGIDRTLEVDAEEFVLATNLTITASEEELEHCSIYIITVPTPIDVYKRPNLGPLFHATETIAKYISEGDIVIYESTLYPGATEEKCVPIIEKISKLKFNKEFFCGYSPERINPGDPTRKLKDIVKITSGSTPESAEQINKLYSSIIDAGTYKAPSIKIAEAAKVIENTQRDVNIGLVNELAIIFNLLKIDTNEVLKAAGTKWNFLPFRPGLVGGHCIGVDPYYLTHKAQEVGYHPKIILAGRTLNDGMSSYVVNQTIKSMIQKKLNIIGAKVLVLGLTFKENCPDTRNTRVTDIINELYEYKVEVDCYDPWVANDKRIDFSGVNLITDLKEDTYDAVLIAVAHNQFREMGASAIRRLCKKEHLIYDLKNVLHENESDLRL